MTNQAVPTAVRTWKTTKTGKTSATIKVRIPQNADGSRALVFNLGGARAERAVSAIVVAWGEKDPEIWGLRSDPQAAAQEAHRMATQTEIRHGGARIAVSPAREAYTIEVTE